ncbi:MAG: glycerol acyltransferase [Chloroflexales bacterium]|nr:glycerol acyltransferase [Chloroflexales bacterium]
MQANIDVLTAMNVADLQKSFKVDQRPVLRRIVAVLGWWPARRLAQSMAACDQLAGQQSLAAAGQVIVDQYATQAEYVHTDYIPRTGAVLICANHPGMVDTSAMFVAINRPDVLVIAADRPLLRALPNVAARLICVPDDVAGRAKVMRIAARHLRNGGALLTFPAGHIEPDPAVMEDAASTLRDWSAVTAFFCRLIPGLPVVGALVSGVISARALQNWWVRRMPIRKDRDWFAATLQLIVPWYRAPLVRVRCAPPLIGGGGLTAVMRELINQERAARQ